MKITPVQFKEGNWAEKIRNGEAVAYYDGQPFSSVRIYPGHESCTLESESVVEAYDNDHIARVNINDPCIDVEIITDHVVFREQIKIDFAKLLDKCNDNQLSDLIVHLNLFKETFLRDF